MVVQHSLGKTARKEVYLHGVPGHPVKGTRDFRAEGGCHEGFEHWV